MTEGRTARQKKQIWHTVRLRIMHKAMKNKSANNSQQLKYQQTHNQAAKLTYKTCSKSQGKK